MVIDNFSLPAVFPFRLDLTAWTFRRRKNNMIDRFDGHQYTRIIVFNNNPIKISLFQKNPSNNPECSIFYQYKQKSLDPVREDVCCLLKKILGPDLNLQPFYTLTENDEIIGPLVRQFSGVKPPRFPTIFEALVNAIACQQVSLDVGIILLNRLAEKFGSVFDDNGTPLYAFTEPGDLVKVSGEELREELRKHDIEYVRMEGLGGLRHTSKTSVNTAWKNASFRGYADYMQTPEFARAIDELIDLGKVKQIVIMCAEAVPWRCHRSLIGDALLVRHIDVVDILNEKSSKPHKITPWAKVDGDRITYPEPAAE